MAWARTVAVVVPSPATSEVLEATSRTIWAPMFSSASGNSISFATVTPSLVMIGAPNFFSITALRPLGPSVIFTASARMLTPRRIDWREFSPVTICFAMRTIPPQFLSMLATQAEIARQIAPCGVLLSAGGCLGGSAKLCQDFVFFENQVFLIVNFDFVAAILAEQDAVANFNVEGDQF